MKKQKNSVNHKNFSSFLITICIFLAITIVVGAYTLNTVQDKEVINNSQENEIETPAPSEPGIPTNIESTPEAIKPIDITDQGIQEISSAENNSIIGQEKIQKTDFDIDLPTLKIKYYSISNNNIPEIDPVIVINKEPTPTSPWDSQQIAETGIFNRFPSPSPELFDDFLIDFVYSENDNTQSRIGAHSITDKSEFMLNQRIDDDIVIHSFSPINDGNIEFFYSPKSNLNSLEIKEGVAGGFYNYQISNPFLIKRVISLENLTATDYKFDIKIPEIEYNNISVFNQEITFSTNEAETTTSYNFIENSEFTLKESGIIKFVNQVDGFSIENIDINSSTYKLLKDGELFTELNIKDNLLIASQIRSTENYILIPVTVKGGFPPTTNLLIINKNDSNDITVLLTNNNDFTSNQALSEIIYF